MGHFILSGVEWAIPLQLEKNGRVHSIQAGVHRSIQAGMKWTISFRQGWNGLFHSGQNGMTHFIPTGMEWPISFWPEWTAPFRPEWNGPFHSGWNGMDHFIPARMEWPISFRPEWNVHSVDANKKYASRGPAPHQPPDWETLGKKRKVYSSHNHCPLRNLIINSWSMVLLRCTWPGLLQKNRGLEIITPLVLNIWPSSVHKGKN